MGTVVGGTEIMSTEKEKEMEIVGVDWVKEPKYSQRKLDRIQLQALDALKVAVGGRPVSRLPLPPNCASCEYMPGGIRHVWMFDMNPESPTFDKEVHRFDVEVPKFSDEPTGGAEKMNEPEPALAPLITMIPEKLAEIEQRERGQGHAVIDIALLLDELEAQRAGAQGQTWQPIESAPKDGKTWVLAHRPGWHQPEILFWSRYINAWVAVEGSYAPTHWMPLPNAPRPAQEGQ